MRRAALAPVAALLIAVPSAAHVVSDRELAVVAQFPAGFAARSLTAWMPDARGFVAPQRAGAWRSVGLQRGAMLVLVDAAARTDTAAAERAWCAIDVAFAHQHPDGGFDTAVSGAVGDSTAAAMADEAAWLAGVCRGFIAVMNSRLQDRFRWRYALLKPKLQRSMDHLERRHEALLAAHARHPEALLATAAAFLLADGTYHDPRYGSAGQQALVQALALQKSNGAFPSDGREDVARHAAALNALQSVVIYFSSPTLERASARGAKWLEGHAGKRGVFGTGGQEKPGNPANGEVEFVLHYAAIKPPPPTGAIAHE